MTDDLRRGDEATRRAAAALFKATTDRVSFMLLELSRLPLREVLSAMEAFDDTPEIQAIPEEGRVAVRSAIQHLVAAVDAFVGERDAAGFPS